MRVTWQFIAVWLALGFCALTMQGCDSKNSNHVTCYAGGNAFLDVEVEKAYFFDASTLAYKIKGQWYSASGSCVIGPSTGIDQ